mgnify:CR=1 FL=1
MLFFFFARTNFLRTPRQRFAQKLTRLSTITRLKFWSEYFKDVIQFLHADWDVDVSLYITTFLIAFKIFYGNKNLNAPKRYIMYNTVWLSGLFGICSAVLQQYYVIPTPLRQI